jgi:hypothetical protein
MELMKTEQQVGILVLASSYSKKAKGADYHILPLNLSQQIAPMTVALKEASIQSYVGYYVALKLRTSTLGSIH